MKIQESAQDYLEAILMISKRQEKVRASDICTFFGYSRPSVSVALKHFRENGLIEMDGNYIHLTEEGLKIATNMYERHQTLSDIFIKIGVSQETAFSDACKIEHDLSEETYQALKNHFL